MEQVSANEVKARAPLFVNSWTAVNADRVTHGKTALVLKSGVDLAAFQAKISAMNDKIKVGNDSDQARVILAAGRDGLRTQAHDAMEAWRKAALYQLDGDALLANLPTLPQTLAADADLLTLYDTVLTRWDTFNAATGVPNFTPPLVTRDGLTRSQFADLILALDDKIKQIGSVDDNMPILHGQRDAAALEVKAVFAEYRLAIAAEYAPDSPFVVNLPTINPPDTGTTPGAVALSVTIDAANHIAHATWTASTATDLARYSFRISAGPRYKSDAEVSIGDLAAGTHEFTVPAQYLPQGSTVWGKVYVVTTEGREKGSDAAKLTP